MLAIVLDENQHSRKVLANMLRRVGFSHAVECVDLRDFDLQCSQHGEKIKLIISALQHEEGLDFPLSRMVIQNPALNLAPLIFMTNRGFDLRLSFIRSRFSRIDSYIHRPFGIESLKFAIVRAFERRAEFRNVVLILKKENDSGAIEASYDNRQESHWEETVFVDSLENLEKKYKEYGFKVGGIVFDPSLINSDVRIWLMQMRKSFLGSATIVGVLGRTPEQTHELREEANFFFSPDTDWATILRQMSHRLRHDWEARLTLRKIRTFQKEECLRDAKKELKRCEKRDLNHWEIEEQRGVLALALENKEEAVEFFKKALELNPAAPSVYLRLIPQLPPSEQYHFTREAKSYCPFHPEIQALPEVTP